MLCSQVKKGTYNSRNNLAILKLYQFYPDKLQREYVEHILVKVHCMQALKEGVQCAPV